MARGRGPLAAGARGNQGRQFFLGHFLFSAFLRSSGTRRDKKEREREMLGLRFRCEDSTSTAAPGNASREEVAVAAPCSALLCSFFIP